MDHHTLHALSDVARAVGATLRIDLFVPGGDLSRLLDADHAAMQEAWHARLSSLGWSVDAEATFNHYGERGSIDLLAWHPTHGIAVVVEIKTVIVDVQDLLASLDRRRGSVACSRRSVDGSPASCGRCS